jgi:hypothetical protein
MHNWTAPAIGLVLELTMHQDDTPLSLTLPNTHQDSLLLARLSAQAHRYLPPSATTTRSFPQDMHAKSRALGPLLHPRKAEAVVHAAATSPSQLQSLHHFLHPPHLISVVHLKSIAHVGGGMNAPVRARSC